MTKVNHLAIIMDGNSRWAKSRNLKTIDGHKQGAENAFNIIKLAIERKISFLSLFAFSSENWFRPKAEVLNFMNLLSHYTSNEVNKINELGVRIKFVGDLSKLSNDLQKSLRDAEDMSAGNKNLTLYILLSYGGRDEIIHAAKKAMESKMEPKDLNEESFRRFMMSDMPDVDLLIRTGDKQRISNFLLWQSAYAELYFSKKFWPDFDEAEFDNALEDYKSRKRSFGVRDEQ